MSGDGKIFEFERWAADEDGCDMETGAPGILVFASAVQLWACMNDRPVSVAEAARVFNVLPSRIVEAVNEHYWMCLEGPHDDYTRLMIEHEGGNDA